MKQTAVIVFVLFSLLGSAQESEEIIKKNELKVNGFTLLLGYPQFTYERLLNEESGLGLSLSFAIDNEIETKFSATPYYRFYFGKKYAEGFFVEGFGMINSYQVEWTNYSFDPIVGNNSQRSERYTDFALGLGVGGKWITKRGVLFEINAGIGRNLINTDENDFYDHTFVGRGGITIGYRF